MGLLVVGGLTLILLFASRSPEPSQSANLSQISNDSIPSQALKETTNQTKAEEYTSPLAYLKMDRGLMSERQLRFEDMRHEERVVGRNFTIHQVLNYLPSPNRTFRALNLVRGEFRTLIIADLSNGNTNFQEIPAAPATLVGWTSANDLVWQGATSNDFGTFVSRPGTNKTDKLDLPTSAYDIALSFDRKQLAFLIADGPNGSSLWISDLDGRNQKLLYRETKYRLRLPSWSPGGGSLAFLRTKEDSGNGFTAMGEILTVNTLGTPILQVLTPSASNQAQITWSPTGKHLAYIKVANGTESEFLNDPLGIRGHIGVIGINGEGEKLLTSDNWLIHSPLWSPGGRSILFARSESNNTTIWSVASGSGTPTIIDSITGQASFLYWSVEP
jgi:hypothetical protein